MHGWHILLLTVTFTTDATARQRWSLKVSLACLMHLHKLRTKESPDTGHRPSSWVEALELWQQPGACKFTARDRRRELSTAMVDTIRENRATLLDWAYAVRGIAGGSTACAVHNDLNHANVLIAGGCPCFLDLEDIVREDPRVAFGHAAFKVARHAVYTGAVSADDVREKWAALWLKQRVAGTRYGGPSVRAATNYIRHRRDRILADRTGATGASFMTSRSDSPISLS